MLPGFACGIRMGASGGGAPPASGWHFDRVVTATAVSSASHTFSGFDIGPEDAGRVVVFAVTSEGAINRAVASAVINPGGITATKIQGNTSGNPKVSLWSAVVPSGTTGMDFVPTFTSSGSNMSLSCACWYGYPTTSTPLDSVISAVGSGVTTRDCTDLQIEPDGFVIGVIAGTTATTGPFTLSWTGADTPTENADGTLVNSSHAYAHYSFDTTETDTTDDGTFTATASGALVASMVSFGA